MKHKTTRYILNKLALEYAELMQYKKINSTTYQTNTKHRTRLSIKQISDSLRLLRFINYNKGKVTLNIDRIKQFNTIPDQRDLFNTPAKITNPEPYKTISFSNDTLNLF